MDANIKSLPIDNRFLNAIDAIRGMVPDIGPTIRAWKELEQEWRDHSIFQAVKNLHKAHDGMSGIALLIAMLDALLAASEAAKVSYLSLDPGIRDLEPMVVSFANDVIQSVVSFDFEVFSAAGIDRVKVGNACAVFASNNANSEVMEQIVSTRAQLRRYSWNPTSSEPSTPQKPEPESSVSGEFTPSALAKMFSVSIDALRKRLDRYRKTNDDGWTEVTSRKPRESKYRYTLTVAKPIIMKLKADLRRKASKKS